MQVLLRQAITGFRRVVERLYQVVFHGLLSVTIAILILALF